MSQSDFERQAASDDVGLVREFIDFLRENRKWWLVPIIVTLLGLGLLLIAGSSAISPFIYPFF